MRPDGLPLKIHVAITYQHMGGIIDVNGSLMSEIRHRGRTAAGAARPLRQAVLSNDGVTYGARSALGQSLIGSRLCYNSHTWRPLGKLENITTTM